MKTPRPYQKQAFDLIRHSIGAGHRRPLLQLPTGGGKSQIAAMIIQSAVEKRNRVLFLAPRRELIYQASRMFADEGIHNGILMAGERPRESDVLVASYQTLHRRAIQDERMDLPEIDLMIVDECFRGDVEVLTEAGFQRFDRLDKAAKVAQVDGETHAISFVHPERHVEREFSGDLVRIRSKQLVDLSLTPNHELLIVRDGSAEKVTAGSVKFTQKKRMLCAGYATGKDSILGSREKLLIALQADGSMRRQNNDGSQILTFSFSKPRKIREFERLMIEGGFEFSEISGKDGTGNVLSRRRWSVRGLYATSKTIADHFDLYSMSCAKARKIIEYMVKWDGHINPSGGYYFSSTDESAVDFYQSVAILAGYKTNKTVQTDDRKNSFKDVYRLFICLDRNWIGTQAISKESERYDGKVYCVTVPAGNIIVRRNGKPVVTGNCHLSITDSYKELFDAYPGKVIIGLTATPARGDGRGLGEVYDDLVMPTNIRELTDSGYLCPVKYYAPSTPDLTKLRVKGGDYVETDLGKAMDRKELIGDILRNWQRLASDKKTVIFCSSKAHGRHVCETFQGAGISAEHIDSDTSKEDRAGILERVESGQTQVVTNVFVMSYGIDIPSLECAVLARPTKNISLYLQTVGRVLRTSPGKHHAIVIDHSGAVHENGFVDDYIPWSLDGDTTVKDRKDEQMKESNEPKEITCGECGTVFKAQKVCPGCGFEAIPAGKPVPFYEADLEEIKRAEVAEGNKANRDWSWEDKIAFMGELKAYAKSKGYSPGWCAHQYRAKFTVWPNDGRVKHAEATQVGDIIKGWISHQNIKRAKSRKRAAA